MMGREERRQRGREHVERIEFREGIVRAVLELRHVRLTAADRRAVGRAFREDITCHGTYDVLQDRGIAEIVPNPRRR